ncbi:MAG: GNAT family N-acetyltransferase [Aggregatilineales bacterium]
MPTLKIYRDEQKIPLPLYYQAETFIRIEWIDSDDYEIDGGLAEPAIQVAVSEGNLLIAYAAIIWLDIEHTDETYHCYGLNSVFTFAEYRRRGFGGQVVEAATATIQQQPGADIALLWAAPKDVGFYEKYGWRAMHEMTTLMGDPDSPDVYIDEVAMMLFVSQKAQGNMQDFVSGRIYVGDEPW